MARRETRASRATVEIWIPEFDKSAMMVLGRMRETALSDWGVREHMGSETSRI